MREYIRISVLSVLLVLFTGCPGVVDSIVRQDLGNGYFYYELVGSPIICREVPTRKCIPTVVKSYDFNEDFIIALQKEYRFTDFELKNYSNEELYELSITEGLSQYWIICHSLDSVFGPMSKNDFYHKRIELGVPPELSINE